ncbi:alpha-L-fucosidase [Parapedobacter tibetensis]|uniref:alpha-L-fucosidase n=1 Tax=Parapedobacter tibetensis TaxID=2972951 RepID=UPI00214DA170|nr:alpha-L-fucosidase [Parapedobacter tibetensis]
MERRTVIKALGMAIPSLWLSNSIAGSKMLANAPIAKVDFKPDWKSLEQYQVPKWFRDAKFGLWAHWGPQCQPERGDWYARGMYQEGSDQYNYHVQKYGHPSKFGFKDVINEWEADKWDAEALLDLYKRAGAQYFVALANHHDNLDLYDSSHQPWNSTKVGPKKDLMAGWAEAAKRRGLRFGVSVHAAHAWTWYETAQRADKKGPLQGIPYDGKITKADGKGKWWDGLDPQDLYAQNHPLSENSEDDGMIHRQWHWGNGVNVPTKKYCNNFHDRTIELIDKYEPDLVYFDDTALPLWPIDDAGLQIAAHYYNVNQQKRNGSLEAVINGKILDEQQRKCMVWDIERGQSNQIEKEPWQTCTCIGSWHYDRRIYENKSYKSAKTVIHMLADVVSKNGNLLLSVPLRGDGSIDSEALKTVEGIASWMSVNSESIIGTRPWEVFGEGPAMEGAAPLSAQGFNEGKNKPFTAEDIRFTRKGKDLYAIVMGWPVNGRVTIKSVTPNAVTVKRVVLLGQKKKVEFIQSDEGLQLSLPAGNDENQPAYVFKIN